MYEIWIRHKASTRWTWYVIGSNSMADVLTDLRNMTAEEAEAIAEYRIITDEQDRPGTVS